MILETYQLSQLIEEFTHLRNIYGNVPVFIEILNKEGTLNCLLSFNIQEDTTDISAPHVDYGRSCILKIGKKSLM